MFSVGSIYFMVQLLLSQAVLLFSYPKKKYFIIKCVVAVSVCIGFAYLLPANYSLLRNPFYSLFRYLILFLITYLSSLLLFDCKKGALLAACGGGYALQHISYHIYSMLCLIDGFIKAGWMELLVCVCVLIIAFFTLGLFVAKKRYYRYDNVWVVAVSIVTVFICVGLNRFIRLSYHDVMTVVCTSLYAITCCMLALLLQYFLYSYILIKTEKEALQRIGEEEKKQYEISKTNMELLNIKYHDIKKWLSEGVFPDGDKKNVEMLAALYDNTVKTGLEVLDVILNEKSLQCFKSGIKLTFMGDGQSLAFMEVMDIYSLFGNALSNAMEAVEQTDNEFKKNIGVTVEKRGDLVFVNVVNYYSGECKFNGNLPVTTKKYETGYHGFGLLSIKNIAKKYGGGIKIDAEDGVFLLSVHMMDTVFEK